MILFIYYTCYNNMLSAHVDHIINYNNIVIYSYKLYIYNYKLNLYLYIYS